MSGNDNDNEDGLGGSWLSADDELGSFLRGQIPAATPGYWDQIDGMLDDVSAASGPSDEGHEARMDTDRGPTRLTAMTDTNTNETEPASNRKPRFLWAAAAALVVIAAIGVGILSRGGSDGDLEVATAPEATETVAPSAPAVGEGEVTPTETAPVAGPATSDEDNADAASAGPLTTYRQRIDQPGNVGENTQTFCFAGRDVLIVPASEIDNTEAVVETVISDGGHLALVGVQNQMFILRGVLFGPATEGVLISGGLFGYGGLSRDLPPTQVTLTDTSITIGSEATLNLAPCAEVRNVLDAAAATIDAEVAADEATAAIQVGRLADDEVLSSAGIGPIRIGMTLSELSAEIGAPIDFETIELKVAGACGVVSTNFDERLWILVEALSETDAIIRRVAVTDGAFPTPSGIRVGMTEQEVIDTFEAQLDISPHLYADGNYLTFLTTDANDPNTVEFVTVNGLVDEIRAGDKGWVSLVEGCA